MTDETIAPTLYRTGWRDRAIPLVLGVLALVSLPFLAWGAGPFLWPWGMAAMAVAAIGSVLALARWRVSLGWVRWLEPEGLLVFRRGRRERIIRVCDLKAVTVRPSSVVTILRTGDRRFVLSHRLLQVERLLDRLRAVRPDLFPEPGDRLVLRVSGASAAGMALLAAGTAGAGVILLPWQPWLAWAFGAGALAVVLRVLWSVPRAFLVGPGCLTVSYGLRRKTWRGPALVREDAYSAGGAVFFRMRLRFGDRRVDIDEGNLLDPLRPRAGWVVRQLGRPGSP